MTHKLSGLILQDKCIILSIKQLKFGSPNGSTILRNMGLDTYFQIYQQVYFSMILQKLSQSRLELNSTTTNEKQLQQMKNKTLCPNTAWLVSHKSYKRKSLCYNTSSHTSNKTMIPKKKSSSCRETR